MPNSGINLGTSATLPPWILPSLAPLIISSVSFFLKILICFLSRFVYMEFYLKFIMYRTALLYGYICYIITYISFYIAFSVTVLRLIIWHLLAEIELSVIKCHKNILIKCLDEEKKY